eukprot:g30983.t1
MEQEVSVLRDCINCTQIVQVHGVEVVSVGNQPARLNVAGILVGPKATSFKSHRGDFFHGDGGATAMEVAPQNLFVWNPHWQCFVWNQNDCAENVEEALNMFLVAFDVDLAAVIELDDASYQSPSGWDFIVGKCGHDLVHLFYNTLRWTPSGPQSILSLSEYPGDRPFVIQQFVGTSGDKVIAVAAHFPHPTFSTEVSVYVQTAQTEHLRTALEAVRRESGIDKVVLMADTNAWSWISNEFIWRQQLGLPGSLVSTRLMQTCCLDADFPPAFTFDRIMANFGDDIQSTALYMGDLPNWTHQVKGCLD